MLQILRARHLELKGLRFWSGLSVLGRFANAHVGLGLGQYERAIQDFGETIRLNPQDTDTYVSRGGAYWLLGQYQRAIEDLDEAIRLDPQDAFAYYIKGVAYQILGKQELAERDFAKAKGLGYEP